MANIGRVLSDIFFGTEQSKYAALAIFITIAILCFFILFTASDISIEQRMVIVFFILLTAVPSILFSLFELTCIVTGGNPNNKWWCYWLAWFITIVIVVYCLFIIISMFLSMASYETAMTTIVEKEDENKISATEANAYAKNIMMQDDANKRENTMEPMRPTEPALQSMQPATEPSMQPMQSPVQSMQPPVQQTLPSQYVSQDYMQNTLDTMGYDASDMYASISGFANAPKDSIAIPKTPSHSMAEQFSGKRPSSAAPEPFSLQSNVKELASTLSSTIGFGM